MKYDASVSAIPLGNLQRLCVYRRILFSWSIRGKDSFHSHELAEEADITPAQVRRDLMSLKTIGTPRNGYLTANIIIELGRIIEGEAGQNIVIVGLGNLGHAILKYFTDRRPDLKIVAAFDVDEKKVGKEFGSLRCSAMQELSQVIKAHHVTIGILTVPEDAAQSVATTLVRAGICSIVNFSPVKLKVPKDVYIEELDISISLEKAAYFAQIHSREVEAETSETAPKKRGKSTKGTSMKRILCIEDDRDIVESYKSVLTTAGYEVEVAYDSESGFAKAIQFKPDVIILDVMMKEHAEGFGAAHKFRLEERTKFTPILMISSVRGNSGLKFDKEMDMPYLPVDCFIEKPVAPNSLLVSVKKLLDLPKDKINVEGIQPY